MTRVLNDKSRQTLQYAVGLMLAGAHGRTDDWDDIAERFEKETKAFAKKWTYVFEWQDLPMWMDRREFLDCTATRFLANTGKLPLELEYWLDENPCEFGWCAYAIGFNDPDMALYFKMRWR